MQPFLMMKQTLDSAFDPGPLLLNGPNVKVTNYAQLLSRGKAKTDVVQRFTVGLDAVGASRRVSFADRKGKLIIDSDWMLTDGTEIELSQQRSAKQSKVLIKELQPYIEKYFGVIQKQDSGATWDPQVYRNRCFLEPMIQFLYDGHQLRLDVPSQAFGNEQWVDLLRDVIHVPGLRGNPERAYPRSAVGSTFPGTFQTYVATMIDEWSQSKSHIGTLNALAADLERLGLTWKITAKQINDAEVELMVGRMPHAQQGGAFDLVNLADVGFGVSQTLPVLVALLAARPRQIVYIEQPEIHLHPSAQLGLASCLVAAAKRGVRVIAETHSSLLIRGIQTALARGEITPLDLSFNWFRRDPNYGFQEVVEAKLDSSGRFGEWPIDFDDIAQQADWAYLDAVEAAR